MSRPASTHMMTAKDTIAASRDAPPAASPAPAIAAGSRDPKLRRLYDYWTQRRGGRRFPARRDIDPLDFPYVLGNVMLVDVLRDPQRFRVRLHGSNLVTRMNYDMTGKFVDELPRPEYKAYVLDRCRGLAASGEPLVLMHDLVLDGWISRYEALWLPLSDDGVQVDLLACAIIFGETGAA